MNLGQGLASSHGYSAFGVQSALQLCRLLQSAGWVRPLSPASAQHLAAPCARIPRDFERRRPRAPRFAGITRDSRHKRRETGGKRHPHQKKRKFETGRPAANTKLGPKRIHIVRARGGNLKYRALRLETGNFSWGSEGRDCLEARARQCAARWTRAVSPMSSLLSVV